MRLHDFKISHPCPELDHAWNFCAWVRSQRDWSKIVISDIFTIQQVGFSGRATQFSQTLFTPPFCALKCLFGSLFSAKHFSRVLNTPFNTPVSYSLSLSCSEELWSELLSACASASNLSHLFCTSSLNRLCCLAAFIASAATYLNFNFLK